MATASAAFALIDVTLLEAAAAAGTGIQTQIVSEAAQLFVQLPAAGMPRSGTGDFATQLVPDQFPGLCWSTLL